MVLRFEMMQFIKTLREYDRDMVTGEDAYPYLPVGFLLREEEDSFGYLMRWNRARSNSFEPYDVV